MYNLDKIILCQYLSELWSHEFEFHVAQVGSSRKEL